MSPPRVLPFPAVRRPACLAASVLAGAGACLSLAPPAVAQPDPAGLTSLGVTVAAVASPGDVRRWEVRTQDLTLSRTLERWAAEAGYRLRWDAARNFVIGAPDVYEGRFEDALQAVLGSAGLRGSDYPLEACIYANRPPLVRVTRLGEQTRECEAP